MGNQQLSREEDEQEKDEGVPSPARRKSLVRSLSASGSRRLSFTMSGSAETVEYTVSYDLHAPIELAYKTLLDHRNYHQWNPVYHSVEGSFVNGGTFRLVMKDGRTGPDMKVTQLDPEHYEWTVEHKLWKPAFMLRTSIQTKFQATSSNTTTVETTFRASGRLCKEIGIKEMERQDMEIFKALDARCKQVGTE